MAAHDLTAARLRELFSYDPLTGDLMWRVKCLKNEIGDVAGYIHKGTRYRRITVDGVKHSAHRLVWLYVHGDWPNVLDHLNGVRDDNRLKNLRNVDMAMNLQNRRAVRSGRDSGAMLGVNFKAKGRKHWQARIMVGGRQVYLGTFETQDQAHAAYVAAKRLHHPGGTL